MKLLLLLFIVSFSVHASEKDELISYIINSDDSLVELQKRLETQSEASKKQFIKILNYNRDHEFYDKETINKIELIFKEIESSEIFDYDVEELLKIINNELSSSYTLEELRELKILLDNPLYKKHLKVSDQVMDEIKKWNQLKTEEIKEYVVKTQKRVHEIDDIVMEKIRKRIDERKNSNKSINTDPKPQS